MCRNDFCCGVITVNFHFMHVFHSVFDGDFLDGLFASFADLSYLERSNDVVREFADELRNRFDIDEARQADRNFNVTGLLNRFLNRIEDEAVNERGSTLSRGIQNCIRNAIQVSMH